MCDNAHTPGDGLKVLTTATWYGGGYCGVCGDRESIIPNQVRWWDVDDGWRVGVLCSGCGEDAAARGPRAGDYAVQTKAADANTDEAARIDHEADDDPDAAYADSNDRAQVPGW